MQTPFNYYADTALYGNYQFVTLKDVIDSLLVEAMDDDSYLKNTRREILILHGKNGVKEMTFSAAKETLAVEITVTANRTVILPHDYVDYEAVFVVGDDRKLYPLDINDNMSTATGYLQDHRARILFDNNGYILTADASNAYNFPFKSYEMCLGGTGGNPGIDTSKYTKYGEFTIDEKRGYIVFSEKLIKREIVLVYKSDGIQYDILDDKSIPVHKYFEQALKDYIYFNTIERRRTVPQNEKDRARRKYFTSLHTAQQRRTGLDLNELNRAMRIKSQLI